MIYFRDPDEWADYLGERWIDTVWGSLSAVGRAIAFMIGISALFAMVLGPPALVMIVGAGTCIHPGLIGSTATLSVFFVVIIDIIIGGRFLIICLILAASGAVVVGWIVYPFTRVSDRIKRYHAKREIPLARIVRIQRQDLDRYLVSETRRRSRGLTSAADDDGTDAVVRHQHSR